MKTFFRHHEWVDWGCERGRRRVRDWQNIKKLSTSYFFSPSLCSVSRISSWYTFFFFLHSLFGHEHMQAVSDGWRQFMTLARVLAKFLFFVLVFCAHLVDCWCGKFRWVHEGFFTSKNITFHLPLRPKVPHFNNFSIFSSSSSSLAIFFHAEIKNSIGSQRCWLYSCENLSRLDSTRGRKINKISTFTQK